MSRGLRTTLAVVLVVLGGIATLAAAAAGFATHALVDRDGFADRVTEAVKKPAVRKELSIRLADTVVDRAPDLVAAERVLEDAGQTILESGALDVVVRRAALLLHDQAFTGGGEKLVLDLVDGLELLGSVVGAQLPELRAQIEPAIEAEVVELTHRGWLAHLTGWSEALSDLAVILPVVALLLFVAAVAVAPRRGRAFAWVGIAVAAAGAGLLLVEVAARGWAGRRHWAEPDAVKQTLDVFFGGLLPLATVLVVAGAVLAAAGSGRFSTDTADRAAGRAWGFVRTAPEQRGHRAARAVVLLALGLLLLAEPLLTLEVLLVAVGFVVVVEGLTEVIALLGGGAAEVAERGRASTRRRAAVIVAGALGLAVVGGVVAFGVLRTPATDASLALACNGSERLCDRPLDRVAFPTAHNAMSSVEDGFVDPNHRRSLVKQLDAGIRGLLIDSLMARPTDRRSSALTVLDGEVRETARSELGEGGVEALQDFLSRRVAEPTGDPEPFLCHIVCELGALRMQDELGAIRDWLERNPREVLVVVIQDLVSPEDTEAVFRQSGLYDHVWAWNADDPAPTLRQMIDENRRLLVMAESDGFPDSWYQPGYERLLKETPYDSPTVDALRSDASCRPNRGQETNPLFLVNHWVAVYPPRPTRAKVVNEREFLLDRIQRCRAIRKAFPNLIAVDFAGIGDVVAVAAEVNGVAES